MKIKLKTELKVLRVKKLLYQKYKNYLQYAIGKL